MNFLMAVHSWYLVDKLPLVSSMVLDTTWLRVLWLFGPYMYHNYSYIVQQYICCRRCNPLNGILPLLNGIVGGHMLSTHTFCYCRGLLAGI